MSYSPAARRRRRRRTLAVLGTAGVVLGVAYGVIQAQGERETARAYLDVAYDAASTAVEVGESLDTLITDIEDYNRATLVERLGVMEASAEEMVTDLVDLEAPASLREASLFLRIAAVSWRSGISESRAGLLALSANPLDEEGLTTLTQGLIDLRVGDRAYAGFLASLGDVDTTLQGGPFPAIALVPPSNEALYEPRDLARRMFLAGSIAPVDDIALADLKLEPGPVGVRDGLPVVAVTSSQSAQVVVSNRGNIDVTGIIVRLRLVSNDGDLYETEQEIPGLEATALTLLTFEDLPVSPGVTYEITVSLTRTDDDEENDSQQFLFIVNPGG
ncbi:MAG TPA: hypothetical protein VFY15_06045 [Acidimicrobiia bacterium]|nr:hypothetical protein [Acidimicrobiia bacterium]